MKPRLLIADDHILFNEGIKQLISDRYNIVGQVFDGKNVLSTIRTSQPDAILLDINLPSVNGFDLAIEIRKAFESLKIIFLSMYAEPQFITRSVEVQVHGYLLKNSTKEELINGIDSVLNGNIYYDPKLNQSKNNHHNNDFFVRQFALTPREIEIIRMIKEGLSTAEIAEKLFVGHETIKTHRKNIYYKLSISKSTELIKFAMENNI